MRKIIVLIVLFAAIGTIETKGQYRRQQTVWNNRYDDGVFRDHRGSYRWEVRERRVWVPEYRTAGIFGIGSRRVPGHYEMRTERVKVYSNNKRFKKSHPHGKPPGQRKKHHDRDRDYRWDR